MTANGSTTTMTLTVTMPPCPRDPETFLHCHYNPLLPLGFTCPIWNTPFLDCTSSSTNNRCRQQHHPHDDEEQRVALIETTFTGDVGIITGTCAGQLESLFSCKLSYQIPPKQDAPEVSQAR